MEFIAKAVQFVSKHEKWIVLGGLFVLGFIAGRII